MAEKFAAARTGFDGVEVSVFPFFDLIQGLDEVNAASAGAGVPVCAICTHSIHDLLVPDDDERTHESIKLGTALS